MGVEIDLVYEGQLHCTATHGPSRNTLTTDAPKDNQGRGESFSPTDLFATAVGSCLFTSIAIVSHRDEFYLAATQGHVTKEMVTEPLRRIGTLTVSITVPAEKASKLTEVHRKKMENAAKHCPVHQSLHPDIKTPITFIYES